MLRNNDTVAAVLEQNTRKIKEKRKKRRYRPWCGISLFFVRLFSKRHKVYGSVPATPCVFLCRHKDCNGVVRAFTDLKATLVPWVLDVFTEYKTACKQLGEYTFPKRLKKGRAFSRIASVVCSFAIVSEVKSLKGIPVYRGENSARSITTIKRTVNALIDGYYPVIFADKDYADIREKDSGDIYKGFVAVATLYKRKTGKDLAFVPVYIGKDKTVLHGAVYYTTKNSTEASSEFFDEVIYGMFNE